MELAFGLSFGPIAGQTNWWRCELMVEFIGNHLGVKVVFVGEPEVGRLFAA